MFGKLLTIVGVVAGAVVMASAATADFCFGWNVQNCQSVTQPSIPLLNVGPINVNCDNCYFEASGKMTLGLEPFTIGIENMVINMVGEVDAQATGTWSFEKQESPMIFSATILHDPLPVTLEIPIVIDFRGSFNGDAQGKVGIQAIGNIGSWESVHKDGHWQHVYPNPTWEVTHTLDFQAGITGDVDFLINPQLNIQAADIFKGSLSIGQNAAVNIQIASLPEKEESLNGDLECTACTFLVGQVEQMVLSNKTVQEIENVLSGICAHLTGTWQTVCDNLVQSDIPLIIGYLEDEFSPQVICSKIGLCTSVQLKDNDTKCSLCNLVVGEVENLLASKIVEEKIETILDDLCDHLAGSMSGICENLVNTYLPAIIQFVEDKYPASDICSKIGFCPATLRNHVYKIHRLENIPIPSICATFMEDFKIDWSGELKLSLLHIDKTFDIPIMDWKRSLPFGSGCPSSVSNHYVQVDEMIRKINKKGEWEAAHNQFSHKTVDELKAMFLDPKMIVKKGVKDSVEQLSLPTSFDARKQWSTCIHPVRDQMHCGSCWAFSASEVASDRLCISKGTNVVMSPEYILECDTTNMGCQGGYLNKVWDFLVHTGTTSDTCRPYTSGSGTVGGKCSNTCSDGSPLTLYKATGSVPVTGEVDMMTELMNRGPIQVAFQVYQDFMSYKSGVYTHTSGSLLGGHAVELVGWDVVNGVKAWIIKNSWNTSWGMNGYFMIRRGTDECGIESNGYTGMF
jgi:cathepsin B